MPNKKPINVVAPKDSWKPTFSLQEEGTKSCSLHCIRMVTGLPIEYISQFMGHDGPTSLGEVLTVLRRFGYACPMGWEPFSGFWQGLPKIGMLQLSAPQGKRRVYHMVCKFGEEIWDSCNGKFDFSERAMKDFKYRIKSQLCISIKQ